LFLFFLNDLQARDSFLRFELLSWINLIIFLIFNFDVRLLLFILNIIILGINIVEFDDNWWRLRLALLGWMLSILYSWSFTTFVLAYLWIYYLQQIILGLFHSFVSCCFSFIFSVLENLSFYWILAYIWVFYQLSGRNQIFTRNSSLKNAFLSRLFRFLNWWILVGRL